MNKPLIIGNRRFLPSQKLINDIPQELSVSPGNGGNDPEPESRAVFHYHKIVAINTGSQTPAKVSQTTLDVWI